MFSVSHIDFYDFSWFSWFSLRFLIFSWFCFSQFNFSPFVPQQLATVSLNFWLFTAEWIFISTPACWLQGLSWVQSWLYNCKCPTKQRWITIGYEGHFLLPIYFIFLLKISISIKWILVQDTNGICKPGLSSKTR